MSQTNRSHSRTLHPETTTHEGTPAHRLTPLQELRRTVMACLLWEDQFYESGIEIAQRLDALVMKCAPADVAAIAIEAREQQKLRHVPLQLCALLAGGDVEQRRVVASTLARVIQRADELSEFVALYAKRNGKKKLTLSAQVKRGLALAFPKFDAYQLAKYDRDDAAVRLRDVLFLCHAKPKDAAQELLWKQLIDGTLPTPDTWETQLSAGKDKKSTWERLLIENKLGALALLRNLRNMLSVDVPLGIVRAAIAVMKIERVLPFRFIAAARYAPQLEADLEGAMLRSLALMPRLPGRTAIVIDTSGSMWDEKISAKSDLDRIDAAAALAILLREVCEHVNVYCFNQELHIVPARHGFALRDAIVSTRGGASCGGLAVERANKDGYDRIVVLTDGQWHYASSSPVTWMSRSGTATAVSPAPLTHRAYMINVGSYKNGIGYGKWVEIDGWSESCVAYIAAIEGLDLAGDVE